MVWDDVAGPNMTELDQLAQRYSLHPSQIQDCRRSGQRAKVESEDQYLFIILKILVLEADNKLIVDDLDLFVGAEFLISVHSARIPFIETLHQPAKNFRPDEVLFRLMDTVVDSYLPLLEGIQVRIESLQARVIGRQDTSVVQEIDDIRATLLELRRVLLNMRHVAFRLQHTRTELIGSELPPFLRDIHDHLAEDLDTINGELGRLVGVLDTYLSTVANRHTEAVRTLTLLGTAVLPILVISTVFGMNVRLPMWVNSSWAFEAILGSTTVLTVVLWWYLKRQN
jgi:magnesium transporter